MRSRGLPASVLALALAVIVLLLPEYVPRHWWEKFLYNENARRIEKALLGQPNILVAEVPFRRDV